MALISRKRRVAVYDRFSGVNTVSGVFRVDGQPAEGDILLFERQGFNLIRQTRAGANGQWAFEKMTTGNWFVVGFPYQSKRATVVDGILTTTPNNVNPT